MESITQLHSYLKLNYIRKKNDGKFIKKIIIIFVKKGALVKKNQINFIIDAFMFLCMGAIAGIGFLMALVLIPGKEQWAKYGKPVDLTFMGLSRHDWGDIHLYIALILLSFLALHIILHWKMITNLYCKLVENRNFRRVIAAVFILIFIIFILFSFFIEPKISDRDRGHGLGNVYNESYKGENHKYPHQKGSGWKKKSGSASGYGKKGGKSEKVYDVKGYLTLKEASNKFNVPVDYLLKELGLPSNISSGEKLGWLRKKYGFTMHDVDDIIVKYKGK